MLMCSTRNEPVKGISGGESGDRANVRTVETYRIYHVRLAQHHQSGN